MSYPKSSVVIARFLKSEGFSEHAQNVVEKYWVHNILNGRAKSRYRKLDVEFSEIMGKLTDAEKLIVGKWISSHKAMSFDAGLRIGLTAFATKRDKEYRLLQKEYNLHDAKTAQAMKQEPPEGEAPQAAEGEDA